MLKDHVLASFVNPKIVDVVNDIKSYWGCETPDECYVIIYDSFVTTIQRISIIGIGVSFFCLYLIVRKNVFN